MKRNPTDEIYERCVAAFCAADEFSSDGCMNRALAVVPVRRCDQEWCCGASDEFAVCGQVGSCTSQGNATSATSSTRGVRIVELTCAWLMLKYGGEFQALDRKPIGRVKQQIEGLER